MPNSKTPGGKAFVGLRAVISPTSRPSASMPKSSHPSTRRPECWIRFRNLRSTAAGDSSTKEYRRVWASAIVSSSSGLSGRRTTRAPRSCKSDLDEERVALPAAGADRGESEPASVPAQLVDHRREDAGARRADWVAEGDSAAVDVHPVGVRSQHLRRVHVD